MWRVLGGIQRSKQSRLGDAINDGSLNHTTFSNSFFNESTKNFKKGQNLKKIYGKKLYHMQNLSKMSRPKWRHVKKRKCSPRHKASKSAFSITKRRPRRNAKSQTASSFPKGQNRPPPLAPSRRLRRRRRRRGGGRWAPRRSRRRCGGRWWTRSRGPSPAASPAPSPPPSTSSKSASRSSPPTKFRRSRLHLPTRLAPAGSARAVLWCFVARIGKIG